MGPYCFPSVCSDKLSGGQRNSMADSGIKDHEPVAGGVCMSPQVLQGERKTVQGTMLCLPWLLMVVCPSFPRLEFKVWVSALTLSSPLLRVGECRLCLADCSGELDPELHWN